MVKFGARARMSAKTLKSISIAKNPWQWAEEEELLEVGIQSD